MGNSIRRKLASHEPQLPRHTQEPPGVLPSSGLGLHRAEARKRPPPRGNESTKAALLAREGVWLGEERRQDSFNQQGHRSSLRMREKSSRDPEEEPSKPRPTAPQNQCLTAPSVTNKERGGH